ncbi:MAG TPA: sialate O-acetylesterase [Terriglobales bacterium]|nr:sialate O-acetylesterase [Terriglobales bacterium]
MKSLLRFERLTQRSFVLWCLVLIALAVPALADVTVPAVLSDGMVLQRDLPVHFWGMANAKERITVAFRDEEKSTVADEIGHWNIYLKAQPAGGPFEAVIRGANTIVIRDILVGDVWVASGQSNMEWPLIKAANGPAEVANANCPNIRLFEVIKKYADTSQEDVASKGWRACSPESARDFSAIAYYFARETQSSQGVPVGVIGSYWGGTIAEAWTSLAALASEPALNPVMLSYALRMEQQPDWARRAKLESVLIEAAKAKGAPWPKVPWRPDLHIWQPSALFNAMIAPLTPFPIRGVIWYQGESNSKLDRYPQLYGRVFETLIRDWRRRWAIGDFPFLYVQLANYTSTPEEDWPTVREGQRSALALRNTGMAVTVDVGNPDDVHPLDKKTVGHRLALAARAITYGEKLEFSGPLFSQITREPNALRVTFDHAKGLRNTSEGVIGFEIAGQDGKFFPADARIEGPSVIVSSYAVAEPISVRYGWANNAQCNLANQEGLPASPFVAELELLH